MAIITPNNALRNTMANDWLTALQAGGGNATIKLYTGTKPSGPDTTVTTQKLLGTLTCSSTPGVVSSGVLTFNAITQDSSADETGTATWARAATSGGVAVFDVDVSDTTGSAYLKLNTTSIIAGGPIFISSFIINF